MEWFKQQLELWPRTISPEELNEELERIAKSKRPKGEDLVSKEETTKIFEEKNAKPLKISWKKNLEEVRKIVGKLEEPELKSKK